MNLKIFVFIKWYIIEDDIIDVIDQDIEDIEDIEDIIKKIIKY